MCSYQRLASSRLSFLGKDGASSGRPLKDDRMPATLCCILNRSGLHNTLSATTQPSFSLIALEDVCCVLPVSASESIVGPCFWAKTQDEDTMKSLLRILTVFVMLASLVPGGMWSAIVEAEPHSSPVPTLSSEFGKLPLAFVPNVGQTDPAARFQAHPLSGTLFFASSEVVLALDGAVPRLSRLDASAEPLGGASPSVVRLRFEGANPAVEIVGENRLPGIANYFLGDDPAHWHANVPTYAGIVYKDLYPGIDLHYEGTSGRLKDSYVVSPGADPARIRWQYEGVRDVRVDENGNLAMSVSLSPIEGMDTAGLLEGDALAELAPVAWQDSDRERVQVAAGYVIAEDGSVGFEVGDYDPSRTLVIDPTLAFSTYLGGASDDRGKSIAVDGAGSVYILGDTNSPDFPAINRPSAPFSRDVFVIKLNAAGNAIIYSTYFGGDDSDLGAGIVVDSAGNAYIAGSTYSKNFPTVDPLQASLGSIPDAFVAKLNPAGNALVYSTYLGGRDSEAAAGIAVDGEGNAYVAGSTKSADFPTVDPFQPRLRGGSDAFVAKLNRTGNALVYSTYLAGNGEDFATGIAVDTVGNAYVAGGTYSGDFPIANALQAISRGEDAFVAKLSPMGKTLIFSTYLGGGLKDVATGIAVDDAGNAYVTGSSYSSDFPVANPLQPVLSGSSDVFVAKLNPIGNTLMYSTYFGGSDFDQAESIAIDGKGGVYIAGSTHSTDFPVLGPVQAVYGGGFADGFVAELSSDGSALLYSTYLGSADNENIWDIAADNSGNAYVTGFTSSSDFPVANALQSRSGGEFDAFVAKIGPAGRIQAVDAKIEIVWPHDETGREGPVSEAPLANVLVYVLERGTLNPVSCAFPNAVELKWAFNLVGKDGTSATQSPAHQGPCTAVQSAVGQREIREVGGKRFPVWVFNDIPVHFVQARDAFDPVLSKMFFTVRVDGIDFRTNVWAHDADARTFLPQPASPRATGDLGNIADAYIDVVFPHDQDGMPQPTSGHHA